MKRALVFLLAVLPATTATAQDVTTTPLQWYGLGSLNTVAYSPDGNYILMGGYMGAFLRVVETGEVVRMFLGHSDTVGGVAFSADGKTILTRSADGTSKLWNVSDGTELHSFPRAGGGAFSPDGKYLLIAGWLYDAQTFQELHEVHGEVFSPDGLTVLGRSGSEARLWDADDGTSILTFSGHTDYVYSVAFSPDGTKVLTGSSDTTAKLWNASDGTSISTFSGHTNAVWSVAFSPDGTKVLTGSEDGTAKLWNVSDGTELRTFAYSWPGAHVHDVAFSPDGTKILTGAYAPDYVVTIWDTTDGTEIRTIPGNTGLVYSVAFSPDGTKVLTGDWSEKVARLWNASDGTEIRTFSGHTAGIWSVAFSPDGTKVLTGSADQTAKLWNAADGTEIRTFSGHTGDIRSVAFSPDGTKILTGGHDPMTRLWNASDGTQIRTFSDPTTPSWSWIASVAFSPDGTKVLTGSSDTTARLWDASDGTEIRTFSGHWDIVFSVAFSPDGSKILTGSYDTTAKLWGASDGAEMNVFGHTDPVFSVAFSPDGTTILTGGGPYPDAEIGEAHLWNTLDGTEIRTFSGHGAVVTSVAFSPDGTTILTGSEDGTARRWPTRNAIADKVILVAGGGNYVGNPIVSQTQALADRALFTFHVRGYKPDDIIYLSAFDDWQTRDSNNDGKPDADAYASSGAFWSAIDSWSSDTGRVILYLIDHGAYDSLNDEYSFFLNPTESIKASELDTHLDALQAVTKGEVVLIVDCCFSGGFIQRCTAPARIVMSATTAQDLAVYTPPSGAESFSFYFLSFAILGNTLEECYRLTKLSFASMGNPAGQDPWMDDNNDGISDKSDGKQASRHVLGRLPAFGPKWPLILDVATSKIARAGESIELWARLDGAVAAKEVWAVIPGLVDYGTTDPVTNLTRVDLSPAATPHRWEGSFVVPDKPGEYTVTYYAASEDSLNTRLVATPVTSGLIVLAPTSVDVRWELLE